MEFTAKTLLPEKQRTDCAVVAVFESHKLSGNALLIDKLSNSAITQIIKQGDFKAKSGQFLFLRNISGLPAERVLLVGVGKKTDISAVAFRKLLDQTSQTLLRTQAKDATVYLSDVNVVDQDDAWKLRQISEVFEQNIYQFDELKKQKKERPVLKKIVVNVPKGSNTAANTVALKQGKAIAQGMALARDLGNLPGNICTPTYLANKARAMARTSTKLTTKIIDEIQMKKLGMGGILSVSAGSTQPAKLIIMEYKGATKTQKPYVLVGKGITFDSGGISIKPGPGMDEMKFDMCGAASVFGTLQAVINMALPINLVGMVTSAENMPSGSATKPGDIITTMAGLTVEVLNTDAEGRLVLCDALTYAERYKPQAVIDIATLTGAMVVALGNHISGLFTNHQKLADQILKAGETACDRAWQFPMGEDYHKQLESNFADIANIGGPSAGSITAACFLARFTEKYHWAHLDIAGTAWNKGGQKGSTGRPVPLLCQYLLNRVTK